MEYSDEPVFLDDPSLRLPWTPEVIFTEEFLRGFQERFLDMLASIASQTEPKEPTETADSADSGSARQGPAKVKDSLPIELDDSKGPVFLTGRQHLWPLPPTISRPPSEPPLDRKYLDTLVPAHLQKKEGEDSGS